MRRTQSFRKELYICFLMVSVIPFCLSSIFWIQMIRTKLSYDYRKNNMQQAAAISERITGTWREFEKVSDSLIVELKGLEDEWKSGKDISPEVYKMLYDKTVSLRGMARFDLYGTDGACYYSTGTGTKWETLSTHYGILKMAVSSPNELVVGKSDLSGGKTKILFQAAKQITDKTGRAVGFVVINMDKSNFQEMLSGTYRGQDGVCILNRFWENIYSAGSASTEQISTVLRERKFLGEDVQSVYNGYEIYVSDIGGKGFASVLVCPTLFAEDTLSSMYKLLVLIICLNLMICILVAVRLSRHLSQPILTLDQAMQKVKKGNLDTRVELEREDEFGQLAETFNIMTDDLKKYMEQQVRQQKELNEVQIAMMQAQLNPHFLYNTLDTMKWIAKENGVQEVALMATKLAKILRTSISSETFIPLQKEIRLVESYVLIQQIRFEGKFHVVYDIPDRFWHCLIPKLMIQPIVENAIIHGLKECEEGTIVITARENEGSLEITVQDDGCGISENVMRKLNEHKYERRSEHIGLWNVDAILRLHYGTMYGVRAQRPESGGSVILLSLPLSSGEVRYDESVSSR